MESRNDESPIEITQKREVDNLCTVRLNAIFQEWKTMEDAIRGYDSIFMGLRGFAITIASGAIATSDKIGATNSFVVAISATILFYIVELHFRTVQRQFINRAREIETYMSWQFEKDYTRGVITMKSPRIGRHFNSMKMLSLKNGLWKTAKDSTGYIVYIAITIVVFLFFAMKHFASERLFENNTAKMEIHCSSLESLLRSQKMSTSDYLALGCSQDRARTITAEQIYRPTP